MSLITIIGRGHSGTRAISQTLSASGVFMGEPLNESGDLLPAEPMYEACRVAARSIRWEGGLRWDWSRLQEADIPTEFTDLIHRYLATVLAYPGEHRGWKIPETTLCFPWIARLFPEARFIFWIRDPRDSIIGHHVTDDLHDFGIDYPEPENERHRRAISWLYQYRLVRATPPPKHWIEVRFEDFVLRQEETLRRLETFLDMPLARLPVRPEAVGRWRRDDDDPSTGPNTFPFFTEALEAHGYLE